MGDYNMLSFLKYLYRNFKQKDIERKVKSSVYIKGDSIITSSAYVKLLYGSNKDDIQIGTNFKLSGSLISSHGGKIKIGDHCLIGPNCVVGAVEYVEIGHNVMVSNNVIVIDNNNHPVNPTDRKIMSSVDYSSSFRSWAYAKSSPIIVCDNVWIGRNSIINKGVTIGENSIIACGSIVTKDVPPNCIVAGNPAKVVKNDIDREERLIADNYGL